MILIKSTVSYNEFTSGRDVDSAVHMEDGSSGDVVGRIEEAMLRPSDLEIDESEYAQIVLQIQTYNAANLPAPLAPTRLAVLRGALAEDVITDSELREMLQLERKGR